MLVRSATTRDCERLFRRDLERRGQRFDHYKKRWQRPAAIAVVQASSNQAVGAAVTVTVTTAAGNLLVICAYQGVNNTSTLAITDSGGTNIWTQVGGYASASTASRMAMFFSPNAAAVTTITATWSGGINATIPATMYEISGAAGLSPLDPNASLPGISSGTATATSLASASISTSNVSGILLYAVGEGGTSVGWSGTNSFLFPTGSFKAGGGRMGISNRITTSVQSALTTTSSWTTTGIDRIGIIAAFMASFSSPEFVPGAGGRGMDQSCMVSY
ncbi:MAG TPA: hypothetical protein VGR34_06130 [Candidatus Dormibacteraeota bacterium]|nr:hypothetical protein [Candidatus Dormibacteraeota bacterium]